MRIPVKGRVILLAGICALYGVGQVYAYQCASDDQVNVFVPGHNTTAIREEFPQPTPAEGKQDYVKTVWVSNQSGGETGYGVSCYVRIAISYSDSDIAKAVSLKGLDTKYWTYDSFSGYYYYVREISEGESTRPLFQGFTLDRDQLDPDLLERIGEFQINVYEESVSSLGFSDYQQAWDYYRGSI